VGLTGGTGAGKSTVAQRLAERGAVVVDADVLAREVVAPGTPGLAAVVEEFGPDVLSADGSLDRGALAALAFSDPERRRALEAITHPRIAARTRELFGAAPPDAVVVHDVPLLVEKRMGANYHLVLVVDAPEEVRVGRLVGRGLTEHDARARIAAQASESERRAAADVWLDNSGDPSAVLREVDRLWDERLVPFEQNLRAGRRAPSAKTALLSGPDPTWPAQAARLLHRIAVAAGDRALGLEHVGSTAVPGLPAKDVIDIQLLVESLDVAESLGPSLLAAGFARMPGEWWDEEPSGHAAKRLHCSCDPARRVNLHVRPPGWTADHQVLFRDWLRAHDDERDAYAAVKRAAEGLTTEAYTDTKGPWIRAAYERADAWAERVGRRTS
jgi:dephospho-CoA kinase